MKDTLNKELTLEDVCERHPEHIERIINAWQAVVFEPERDIACELSDLNLSEEEIAGLNNEVLRVRYAD